MRSLRLSTKADPSLFWLSILTIAAGTILPACGGPVPQVDDTGDPGGEVSAEHEIMEAHRALILAYETTDHGAFLDLLLPAEDLLIFLEGGGACWSDFCLTITEATPGFISTAWTTAAAISARSAWWASWPRSSSSSPASTL